MSGHAWNAADMPDLAGRVAVVTGANSGLGKQTALELARHGAEVVLACRDTAKGEAAAIELRRAGARGELTVQRLDLADLDSVRTAADEITAKLPRVDVLVNNAGVMAVPRRLTADGFEMQFGTNHLGHFALTGLLMDHLLKAEGPRVVTVSSNAHKAGRIGFDDLSGRRRYHKWVAYSQSKLANLLFAFELQRRARAAGLALLSVAAHPGYARSNLSRRGPEMAGRQWLAAGYRLADRVFAQDDATGALPILYAAAEPEVTPGGYYGPQSWFGWRGAPGVARPTAAARDEASAGQLWELSVQLTGVDYPTLRATGG